MLKDLQWFEDREGSFILRGTTEVFVASKEVAKKLYEAQDEKQGYVFTEKLIVHRKPPESCESCSA